MYEEVRVLRQPTGPQPVKVGVFVLAKGNQQEKKQEIQKRGAGEWTRRQYCCGEAPREPPGWKSPGTTGIV